MYVYVHIIVNPLINGCILIFNIRPITTPTVINLRLFLTMGLSCAAFNKDNGN